MSRSSKRGAGSAALRAHLAAIRACERSGESLKSYAERQGVSVHALYSAKKTARDQGLLPPHSSTIAGAARVKRTGRSRFVEARRTISTSTPVRPSFRIRLASGEVLECDGPLHIDDIVLLVKQLRVQS